MYNLENKWKGTDSVVRIEVGESTILEGHLAIPKNATGIVVFVHGSGSSRHSPRNQYVARVLNEAGLGTLLFDLLTDNEERVDAYTRALRFDIGLLADRVVAATRWLKLRPETAELNVGYFGASTGAAAALVAAAELPEVVKAVVSRGGRPDLAAGALAGVSAPTLMIVGERDYEVIELNKIALRRMPDETVKRIILVPKATHLFEEPGTLERAAFLASDWFGERL